MRRLFSSEKHSEALSRLRTPSPRSAPALAAVSLLTTLLLLAAIQFAASETMSLQIVDWQNNVITTKTANCACTCPCTGAECMRECTCTYDWPRSCTVPGLNKVRAKLASFSNECDGKTTGSEDTWTARWLENGDLADVRAERVVESAAYGGFSFSPDTIAAFDARFDNVRVRNYRFPEPTTTTS